MPAFPLHVVFILDNRCNLRCIHCSSNASTNASVGLAYEEAKEIVAQLAAVGVMDIAYSGGEPLLRPDLPALVRFARGLGISVGTSTNGYPLTARKAQALRSAGLSRLQVSLDGPRDTHDRIRGRGAYDRAVRAISRSLDAGLRTHVCFTAMRMNADLLEEVIELAFGLGVHGFNLSQFVATGRGSADDDLTPAQARSLLTTWLEAKRARPDHYFTAHASGLADLAQNEVEVPRAGCQAGMSIACIMADGSVTPCVMLPLPLGNLRQRSFREIWTTHPVLDAFRRRDVSGRCGACQHRLSCGGCRAAAWARYHDPLAGDPRCWKN